jgi:hypothetical protein
MTLQSAIAFADLIDAAFDLYHRSLYDALGWPYPKNSLEEIVLGSFLTEFLWRGTGDKRSYVDPPKE